MLMIASVLLAGCTGGNAENEANDDGVAAPAAPAEFGDDTGAIEGLVVDVENFPVVGAQIGIPELGLSTLSDPDGVFTFSNVEPGTYEIFATRVGYASDGQRVEVVAGDSVAITFSLTPIATEESFHAVQQQRGIFGCGSSWRPAVAVSGIAACGVLGIVGGFEQYDKFLLVWPVENKTNWASAMMEMQWQTNQVTGHGLSMIWEVDNCPNVPEMRFGRLGERSPLQIYVTQDVIKGVLDNVTSQADECDDVTTEVNEPQEACGGEDCRIMSRVFSHPATLEQEAADIGITFQQPFDQYLTVFYFEPGPEEYSALPE